MNDCVKDVSNIARPAGNCRQGMCHRAYGIYCLINTVCNVAPVLFAPEIVTFSHFTLTVPLGLPLVVLQVRAH